MSAKTRFDEAVKRVKTLPSAPSNDVLLSLYGLFKQATEGDVQGSSPSRFNLKARAKFDAWTARKGLTAEAAMKAYADLVDRLF